MTLANRLGCPLVLCVAGLLAACSSDPPPPPEPVMPAIRAGTFDYLFRAVDMRCIRKKVTDQAVLDGWTLSSEGPQSLVLDRPTAVAAVGERGPAPLVERLVLAFVPANGGTRMLQGAAVIARGADGAERTVSAEAVSERQVALFQTAIQAERACGLGVPLR